MEFVRAVLYELQPFRIIDVKNLFVWISQTSVTVLQESIKLKQSISSMPLPSWRICGFVSIWIALYVMCIFFGVGTLWFMLSAFVAIVSNLGERKPGEASAYSVFNEGFHSILGTMTAEQFEKEIRHDNNFGDNNDLDDDMIDYAALVERDDNHAFENRDGRPNKPVKSKKRGKKARKLLEEAKRTSSTNQPG